MFGVPDEKFMSMGVQVFAALPQRFEYTIDDRLMDAPILYDLVEPWQAVWTVFDPIVANPELGGETFHELYSERLGRLSRSRPFISLLPTSCVPPTCPFDTSKT